MADHEMFAKYLLGVSIDEAQRMVRMLLLLLLLLPFFLSPGLCCCLPALSM